MLNTNTQIIVQSNRGYSDLSFVTFLENIEVYTFLLYFFKDSLRMSDFKIATLLCKDFTSMANWPWAANLQPKHTLVTAQLKDSVKAYLPLKQAC